MPVPSTFSIVGHDPVEGAWGVAVASKFPAVGAVVPWAKAGIGAVATQSFANTSFGPGGLERMQQGMSAREALDELLVNDTDVNLRQVGMIDAQGQAATFTGSGCFDWAGGITGPNFAAQGNILVGANVVQAMAYTFTSSMGSLDKRLYAALVAGDRGGGDRRGRQSAAILVVKAAGGYGGYNDRWIDYRVDDDPDPIMRLGGLLELHDLYFGKSAPEDRISLTGPRLITLQRILIHHQYLGGSADGEFTPTTRKALDAFIGNENFEERVDLEAGWMDAPVFDFISRRFSVEAE